MDELAITGLSVEDSFDAQCAPASEPNVIDGRFSIMLGHAPDFALSPNVTADLLVAGHTHGGQVALPLIQHLNVSRMISDHTRGIFQRGETTLYVNRGLGVAGLPLRLNCPREIALIEWSG